MVTVGMLLMVVFFSGALADCPNKDPALFITAPKKLEALSGSCLQIPCSFRPKEEQKFEEETRDKKTRKIFGVWIKNNSDITKNKNNVIFNSNGAVSIYPMSITGNLSQRDCTTLFSNLTTNYTDTYFFRVESEPFKATAACDSLQITVRDSPWRPNITIPGDLKEKESVTITCSALTPCPHSPPQLTWNLTQDSHNKTEQNTDGNFTTKIQQTITLSDTHDGKKISCSARYPVNQGKDTKTAETEETLSVSYAPKDTSASISPSGLVSAGSWVNLTCSSRAKPPVSNFTWFKKSRDGAVKVSEREIYSFNVTDGGVYYCVATNDLGNQTSAESHVAVGGMIKPVLWGTAIGAIIGIIILICMVFILWYLKSTHVASHPTQSLSLEEAARTAENEDVHYNEIEISKQRPSLDSVQDSTQQQDVVYSQVKECKTEKRLTQTSDGECFYAQVQKN
ncbi:myelin-associated glycoprotein-like [Oreochromis aureus]|uniref:Ig-like domain-containing protein n=1 Tax=Oreochromis aureus TaxID=47969 RepID=A0AAZ1Y3D5_OREAU|nr:myelin-associated glycoprotein-like [Oreochromis aureus]XP_039473494.1 myelin-associated glycoprotein-like [Oreochromis aureus]XP_039473495.1 myelin-associated glycoprotein-like [Oreochromis aureus]XP_039473496.1 myelin-associated glycoprotein-like [Oreochromis aureus]